MVRIQSPEPSISTMRMVLFCYSLLMSLKYKVTISLFLLACILGFGGYAADLPYAMIAGLLVFALSFMTLFYSEKNDTSIISILADGLFGILK